MEKFRRNPVVRLAEGLGAGLSPSILAFLGFITNNIPLVGISVALLATLIVVPFVIHGRKASENFEGRQKRTFSLRRCGSRNH